MTIEDGASQWEKLANWGPITREYIDQPPIEWFMSLLQREGSTSIHRASCISEGPGLDHIFLFKGHSNVRFHATKSLCFLLAFV